MVKYCCFLLLFLTSYSTSFPIRSGLNKAGGLISSDPWNGDPKSTDPYSDAVTQKLTYLMAVFAMNAGEKLPVEYRDQLKACVRYSEGLSSYARCMKPAFALENLFDWLVRFPPAKQAEALRRVSRRRTLRRSKRQLARIAPNGPLPAEPQKLSNAQNIYTFTSILENIFRGTKDAIKEDLLKSNKLNNPAVEKMLAPNVDWRESYNFVKDYLDMKDWRSNLQQYLPLSEQQEDATPKVEIKNDSEKLPEDWAKWFAELYETGLKEWKDTSPEVMSPKAFPIFPKEKHDVFSPDVMGFFPGKGVVPIPDLLHAGMKTEEADAMMDLIMRMTGAGNILHALVNDMTQSKSSNASLLSKENLKSWLGENWDSEAEWWKRVFEQGSTPYLKKVVKSGYGYLNNAQLDSVYGQEGRLRDFVPVEWDMERWKGLSNEKQRDRYVKKYFTKNLASGAGVRVNNKAQSSITMVLEVEDKALGGFNRRLKEAVVLSPALWTPGILAPGVLGPLILSPGIGNPLVLSPYGLGPSILSPSIFNTEILSPNFLSPDVLNPGIMEPAIVGASVLTPAILSPYLLSPAILNPYILNPAILSPGGLNPGILSPNALSPGVLSDSFLSPSILSPSVLSKK